VLGSIQNSNFSNVNKLNKNRQNTPAFQGNHSTRQITKELETLFNADKTKLTPTFLNIKAGFITEIAAKIANNIEKRRTLMLTGMSASGKTTNVAAASEKMAPNSLIFLTGDHFYKDRSKELKEAGGDFFQLLRSGISFDVPESVRLNKMVKTIIRIANGEKDIKMPHYDYKTCCVTEDHIDVLPPKKGGIIVGDTIFALHETFAPITDIGMYVHAPDKVIKERWYARAAARGKTGAAADELYNMVMKEAIVHIRPGKEKADVVVNGMNKLEDNSKSLAQLFKIITREK